MQGVQFGNCQEWQFQISRRSDNCSTILQEGDLLMFKIKVSGCETLKYVQCCPEMRLNADAQESRFQEAKRSEMCSAVMKGLRFSNTQQSCFEA